MYIFSTCLALKDHEFNLKRIFSLYIYSFHFFTFFFLLQNSPIDAWTASALAGFCQQDEKPFLSPHKKKNA